MTTATQFKMNFIFYLRIFQLHGSLQNADWPQNLLQLTIYQIPKGNMSWNKFSKIRRTGSFQVVVLQRMTTKCQGRSQPFCIEGFLMYIAWPIDNRAPEALFTRGVGGMLPRKFFEIWVFRNGVSLILSTNFQ